MKKIINLLIVVFVFANIINAQSDKTKNDVIFKFNNKEVISNNFVDKTNDKFINFEIVGIDNIQKEQELVSGISNYRGVKEFSIEKMNSKFIGHLHLYEYADHWMYYKFLFIRNGVNTVVFGNQEFESEKLSEL